MQHDDRSGCRGIQRAQHAWNIDAVRPGAAVRVGADAEAGAFEQRTVVFPARVADENFGLRIQPFEEIGADLESAGTAESLHRGDAARLANRVVGTKYEVLNRAVVGGDAVDRQVIASLRRLDHYFLGGLDAGEQRQLAVFVEIDADTEVDLGRIGVGVELFVDPEDRVAGSQFDGGEERRHGTVLRVGKFSEYPLISLVARAYAGERTH